MPFEDILAITNPDQRNQALRFVGDEEKEKFLSHVKAEVIDEMQKITFKGRIVYYKLYEIPKGDIFSESVKVMYYTCPSTGLKNFSGVPKEMKTVAKAMAWKMSNKVSSISLSEWIELTPLIDEA
jgi:hypothetical protein